MDADKLLSDLSLNRAKNTPVFPVLHSILSASELLKEVGREYGIGTPTSCRLLRTRLNDTYQVRTTDQRYIFRVYRSRWRSLSEISYELEFLLHLRKKGIAVSVPVPRRDGSLVGAIRAPEGIRYAVLFTYAPGNPLYGKHIAEHAQLFGQTMARFHHASDDFYSPYSRRQLDFTLLLDEPLRALQPLMAHRRNDWQDFQLFAEQIRTRINALLQYPQDRKHDTAFTMPAYTGQTGPLPAINDFVPGLDWGPCHGNPTSANAHISDNQQITLFGFDFCGSGWRAYDIAGVYGIARAHNDHSIWNNFLHGYLAERPLKDIDLYAAPLFDMLINLWNDGLHAANGDEWGIGSLDDDHFDRMLHTIQEWEAFYTHHLGHA